MTDEFAVVEVSGNFSADVVDDFSETDIEALIDVAIGTGFGAERIVKFIVDLSRPSLEALKSLLMTLARSNHVTGLKVTKNGVEIASFPAKNTDDVMRLIDAAMDKLHER